VTFTNTGNFYTHTQKAITKEHAAAASLRAVLKSPRQFSLSATKKLLTSILHSTTLYGAGIWGLQQAEKLETVQQRFLKGALVQITSLDSRQGLLTPSSK
jgi:hypothetical protein